MPLLAALLAAQLAASAPADGYRLVNPRAIELFENDRRLMQWAVGNYDSDHNGYLSIFEADEAAHAFKQIADGDNDGQVTPGEYRSAVDFVVARYAGTMAEATRQ